MEHLIVLMLFPFRLALRIYGLLRRKYLIACFAGFGDKSTLANNVDVEWPSNIRIGSNVSIGNHVSLWASSKGKITIGDGCAIAAETRFVTPTHDYNILPVSSIGINKSIVVGKDVWIGTGAIILPGLTIHDGAIVGAGAVVTKDVPPDCVVGSACPSYKKTGATRAKAGKRKETVKLHIGCGKKYLPGYKHVDVIDYDHVDYICDARHLNMIEDETISEIYACHVLEHVERSEVTDVLCEWSRVLRPDGVIRVAVPDFGAIVEEYLENRDLMCFQGLLYGGQTYDYNFHHIAFDYEVLKGLLEDAGFSGVCRYKWQEFLSEGYDDYSRAYLPHMDLENGRLMSLNVMARKNK